MTTKLAEILNSLGSCAVKSCGYLNLWQEIVDENVKKQTAAVKISNQVLYVTTSAPVWSQELSFFKNDLVGKFNQRAGREIITDIRFKSA